MHDRQQQGSALARMAVAVALVVSLLGAAGVALMSPVHVASAATPTGTAIANAAASQAGVPYCAGGGGINGPSQSPIKICSGGPGYDCMSLAQYAVYQVTGITVPPGDGTPVPGDGGTFIDPDGTANLLPGDVLFFGGPSLDTYVHSGIYAGDGEIWDALTDGTDVQEHSFATLEVDYQNVYWGQRGTRPAPFHRPRLPPRRRPRSASRRRHWPMAPCPATPTGPPTGRPSVRSVDTRPTNGPWLRGRCLLDSI